MTAPDPQAAAMSIPDARAPRLGAETPSRALWEAVDACRTALSQLGQLAEARSEHLTAEKLRSAS
jgi:hypothetical protein